jgi:hypothetical protein
MPFEDQLPKEARLLGAVRLAHDGHVDFEPDGEGKKCGR